MWFFIGMAAGIILMLGVQYGLVWWVERNA